MKVVLAVQSRLGHLARRTMSILLAPLFALLLFTDGPGAAVHGDPGTEQAIQARSLVSAGDPTRLHRVLRKAQRGEPITVGVIGGSITQGAAATRTDHRYGNLIAAWWQTNFPSAEVKFVNAGIGATGSDYGALRVGRDLLGQHPDFVVVEYAVNDANTPGAAATLEGLLRHVLAQPNHPAVLLLFMMNQQGANAQEWFTKVGEHYQLPMVSYRDALWPEIQASRMRWGDISPDSVHPNDRGHQYAANFILRVLQKARETTRDDATVDAIPPLPLPRFSDLYAHTVLIEADALTALHNDGWTLDLQNHCWKSHHPGSAIEFDIEGRAILTMHWVVRGAMGRARVTVDDRPGQDLDGWFDQTWGGYRKTTEVARNLSATHHKVRLELLPDKAAESSGHEFRLFGLGAAGE